ncbi:hypothetical protein KSP39_PZI021517 [Platanthera zijinensis]|uniref:Glabrous enhancer-binding protein-like DBD domain-containing protein n=1 Tax=Platanthera zijinensis TaxID=2320716 RepID=A0AAP0FWL0_9ASPA
MEFRLLTAILQDSNEQLNSRSAAARMAAAAIAANEKMETTQWTEEEELRLLRAVLVIAREPVEATFSPVLRVRRAVGEKFSPEEIVAKTKLLRKKYEEMSSRRRQHSGGESSHGDVFGPVYEISDQIWGSQGSNNDAEKEKQRKGKEKVVE